MKKLLIATVAAVSLVAPFVTGAPVRDAQARPDCQAVDYAPAGGERNGVVDTFDIASALSQPGGQGRVQILVRNFGETC